MSIKLKTIFSVLSCFLLSLLLVLFLINKSYNNNLMIITEQSIKTSASIFNNLEKNDTKTLSATLESLLVNKELKEAFIKKDRDGLFKLASPLFNKLHERYNITHWYFLNAEPENTCFLRVHNPAIFGDVISRATYNQAVKTKDIGNGKELGKTAFALRVVYPYYDGDKLLGYMELGEEIDHFLGEIKGQTGNDFLMLVSKKYVDAKEWEATMKNKGSKNNWDDMKDVVLAGKTTDNENILKYVYKDDLEKVPDTGIVLEKFNEGSSVYVRGVFPIYDVLKRKVGIVFVIQDITKLHNEISVTTINTIISIGIFMLIISLIIIYMLNNLIFNRLVNITDKMTKVVGGDYNVSIDSLSDDEIGKFEILFEQFRKLFVNILDENEKKDN